MFNTPNAPYDMIIGLDVLISLGISILCTTKIMSWQYKLVSWKLRLYFDDQAFADPIAHVAAHYFVIDTNVECLLD